MLITVVQILTAVVMVIASRGYGATKAQVEEKMRGS